MSEDPVKNALELLGRPVEPPAEFAEALLRRLREEVERERAPTPPRRRRRRGRPGLVLAAAAALLAAAAAAAIVVALRPQPASAQAILSRAERQFASVPPFRAIIVRRVDGSIYQAKHDWTYEHVLLYRNKRSWRRTVLSDSFSPRSPFWAATGTGSFFVWDGRFLGIYRPHDKLFELYPAGEIVRGHFDSYFTFLELSPNPPSPPQAVPTVRYLTKNCTKVLADERVAGRRAHHLSCGARSSHFELWLDAETGFLLKRIGPREKLEVRSIEYEPSFPAHAFGVIPPPGVKLLWQGPGAPPRGFPPKKGASP